jgi:hypothetical protein
MGDYANVYGDLRMADGTHKLSQYDFVFIIWMGIDGLGKSVFLGTTCNFSENADTIVRGAKLFFPSDHVDTKIRAGYFQEYFDPFADNEITITENVIDANTPCLKRGGVNVESSLAVDSAFLHKKIKEVGSDSCVKKIEEIGCGTLTTIGDNGSENDENKAPSKVVFITDHPMFLWTF